MSKHINNSPIPKAVQEVLPVTLNGQTAFTLASTPSGDSAFELFLNGQLRQFGVDYSRTGTSLTWNDPGALTLVTTDELIAIYDSTAFGITVTTGVTTADYLDVYDTTTQIVASAGVFQDVTFNTNYILNGWSHTLSTANFTCNQSGVYLVTIEGNLLKAGGAVTYAEIIGIFNGLQIAGSVTTSEISNNNIDLPIASTFLFSATAGQIFKVQLAGGNTFVRLIQAVGLATVHASVSVVMNRIA